MVEKFKKILAKIIETKGVVTLFAIMKMDDLTGKWTIILAAPWAEGIHGREAFDLIFTLISKYLDEEEKNSIARIGIFNKNEHLIEALLQYKNGAIVENQKINGNMVHQAYILESNSKL